MKFLSERVILTNQCNCNCFYCYQTLKPDWMLSYDVALKRINQIKEMIENKEYDHVHINLFGGEPMLNWTVFELYLRELGNNRHVSLSTITNGTLIDQNKINIIKECDNFQFFISHDGIEKNPTRILKLCGPANDIIDQNIKLLIKNGITPNIRLGVSKYNIDELDNNLKYLKELGIRNVIAQSIVAKGFTLSMEESQRFIDICDSYMNLNFRIQVFCKQPIKLKDKKIKREDTCGNDGLYSILQANGVMYIKDVKKKLDLLDSQSYLVRYDDKNLKHVGLTEIYDLSTDPIRYKKL